jgi:hypothetical protein
LPFLRREQSGINDRSNLRYKRFTLVDLHWFMLK